VSIAPRSSCERMNMTANKHNERQAKKEKS